MRLRLAGREASWKEAEILLLRHQLGVLQRQQVRKPRLTWADHGLIAVVTRRHSSIGMHSPVTYERLHQPSDTTE
jgi:hypothetical protein